MLQRLDHYDIHEEIGRGGFAVVYHAHDTRLNRPVALKIIHGNHAQDEGFVTRFRQEAEIAANLHHPRLIPVYDYGDYEGQLYLVMRLVPGGTLRDYLKKHAPLSLAQTISLLQQIASVLDYLHGKQLIHRDVKPSNILLEPLSSGLTAILTDFGLVRSVEKSLTLTDQVLGTPTYMAPEQVNAKLGSPSPQTDIYALTVIAYEMLTGRPPFVSESPDGDSPVQLMMAHASTPPPSPLQFRPELGTWVADVLLKGLAKQPASRYSTATAMVEALQQVLQRQEEVQQRQNEGERLRMALTQAQKGQNWNEAISLLSQLELLEPDNSEWPNLLEEAMTQRRQRLQVLTNRRQREARRREAKLALEKEAWEEAIQAVQELLEGEPDPAELQAWLQQAEKGQWWQGLYQNALARMQAQEWRSAAWFWVQLLNEQPAYRDGQINFLATVKEWLHESVEPVKASDFASLAKELKGIMSQAGETQVWEKDGKIMVYVPAGEFLYGSDKEKIYLDGFWIDKTPVTNAEYKQFLDASPNQNLPEDWDDIKCSYPEGKDHHPVIYINWNDALAYAQWAGKRLPTEREWEKAARGTDGRVYPWGGWRGNRANTEESRIGGTSSVGQYSPQGDSPYGCVDMVGNVWEWTDEWLDEKQEYRVLRGGSSYSNKTSVGCIIRNAAFPMHTNQYWGFRCCFV